MYCYETVIIVSNRHIEQILDYDFVQEKLLIIKWNFYGFMDCACATQLTCERSSVIIIHCSSDHIWCIPLERMADYRITS